MTLERRKIASIGQVLLKLNKITTDQLREVLLMQKDTYPNKPIGELLVDLGYITKDDLSNALALQFLYPQIELHRYKLTKEIIDLIPKDTAHKYKLVPLDRFGKILTLGMHNPLDKEAIEAVEKLTQLKTRVFMVSLEDLEHTLTLIYR